MNDWREPYRSMDASGSPESAGQIGWTWIEAIARAQHDIDPHGLEIDHPRISNDGGSITLYRDRKLIAAAVILRDPMNFAILIRWLSPALEGAA